MLPKIEHVARRNQKPGLGTRPDSKAKSTHVASRRAALLILLFLFAGCAVPATIPAF